MPKLPVCSGKTLTKVFEKVGWTVDRRKGSHVSLVKPGAFVVLTVPDHDSIDRGLLRGLLRKAGISVSRFASLLEAVR